MNNTPASEFLSRWIESSKQSIATLRSTPSMEPFCDDYLGLLESGSREVVEVAGSLAALLTRTIKGDASLDSFLDRYVSAMAVPYDSRRVFLPSFSDTCLRVLGESSPFRGLHYCWTIGEIICALRENNPRRAHDLADELLRLIGSESRPRPGLPQRELDEIIVLVKRILVDVILKRKAEWTEGFVYPCRGSTHFYLSGLRFYWSPVLRDGGLPPINSDDSRFCVQSTSSGLFSGRERYGYLLPDHWDPKKTMREARHLRDSLPPGSLSLSLATREVTSHDRTAAGHFETWSRLVAKRSEQPLVALSDACDQAVNSPKKRQAALADEALRSFEVEVAKNPMRTFYFDCGMLGAAQLHAEGPERVPPVQYTTTQASDPRRDPTGVGEDLFESVVRSFGQGLRIFRESGTSFRSIELPQWTLVPLGRSLKYGTHLWSNRSGATAPILHGFEGRVTKKFSDDIHRYAGELRHHLKTAIAVLGGEVLLSSGAAVSSDLPVSALSHAAIIVLLAAGEVGKVTVRTRSVHNELRHLSQEGSRYKPVGVLSDWG